MSVRLEPSPDSPPAARHPEDKVDIPFDPPLPPCEAIAWDECDLGAPRTWPHDVRAYSVTIAALSYPAAVLYGDHLILLHNAAWAEASGCSQQGRRQRGFLSPDVWRACQSVLQGAPARQIRSRDLLRTGDDPSGDDYTVSLSPLSASRPPRAVNLLVQLLPRSSISPATEYSKDQMESSSKLITRPCDGSIGDSVPLDEHPFFHRFAEMLPTGLAILDRDAQAVYVNQVFYSMTTHRGADQSFYAWPDSIHQDDKDRVLSAYREAFSQQRKLRTEFRSQGDGTHPWRLLLLTPLGDENLQHVSLREYGGFICCIVDISSEKSAELSERRAAKEAEERKSALTSFIDMVSHEIRNPLSAVLHCSEDISDAIGVDPIDAAAIQEAVETINICIAHQKNIVDDVLSFSKLDASMLTLVPSHCQPAIEVAKTLKMFQPELRKTGIDFDFRVDQSYRDCDITWTMTDAARIGQVLINLMSNAIKFTARGHGGKKISISLGGSRTRPTSYPSEVVFFDPDQRGFHMDATHSKDWGNGETVYIAVAVQDTGIGISKLDQQKLFERFRQATPKTAETYGGSGLGLNISRKLCQLHGGEIGVSASEGTGSTFAFFFKVKRSEAPSGREGDLTNVQELEGHIKELNQHVVDGDGPIDRRPSSMRSKGSQLEAQETKLEWSGDRYAESERSGRLGGQDQGSDVQRGDVGDSANVTTKSPRVRQHDTVAETRSRAHILLVEDNIINQRLLFRKLEGKGFSVTTANNGREAVEAVVEAFSQSGHDRSTFDIILMDNEMPILDGNGATKELRDLEEKGEIKHIPILGVTANVRGAQQNEMLHCGMDDVISKPYRIEDMTKRIDKILDESRPNPNAR